MTLVQLGSHDVTNPDVPWSGALLTRGPATLILLSTIFQLTLFAIKKTRSNVGNYLVQLRASLVESVVNV